MRKFSKILTVLLTLALLCGVILSVVAQAETSSSLEALNVSGHAHNKYDNYNSGTYSSFALNLQHGENVQVDYVANDGDGYVRFTSKGNSAGTKSAEAYFNLADFGLGTIRSGKSNIGNYDYVVVDFDLGADKYVYTDAAGAYHTVATLDEVPAEYKDSATISFYNGLNFNVHGRAADGTSVSTATGGVAADGTEVKGKNFEDSTTNRKEIYDTMLLATVLVDGEWYLRPTIPSSAASKALISYTGEDIKLSNKVGEFDHISYVFKTVRTESASVDTGYSLAESRCYIFVNGELIRETKMGIGSYETWSPAWLRFGLSTNQYKDAYSYCVDNVAINCYGGGAAMKSNTVAIEGTKEVTEKVNGTDQKVVYTLSSRTYYTYDLTKLGYTSEGYGIDDYISSGDYKIKGLWNCSDVVYGSDYVNPNGKVNIGAKLEALDNGDVLNIKSSYANVDVPANLLGFKVVAEDGAKFSLSAASLARYDVVETVDGTTTTYVINAKVSALVNQTYNVTGDANNVVNNYDSGKGSWTAYRDSGVDEKVVAGANGNNYLRLTISAPGVATSECLSNGTTSDKYWNIFNSQFGPNLGMKNTNGYSYVTIDFDIGADSHYYSWQETLKTDAKEGTVTKYSTSLDDIPEGVTYKDEGLAYPAGFYIYLRSSDQSKSNSGLLNVNFVKRSDGTFYVKSGNTTKTIDLASELGVFDHFTFVVAPVYNAEGVMESGVIYCYVNGELLYQVAAPAFETYSYLQKLTITYGWETNTIKAYYPLDTTATTQAGQYKDAIDANVIHEFGDKYSAMLDNMAMNFYAPGASSTQALDTFFGDFDADANLASCYAAVYNQNYVGPNVDKYLSINGVKTYNPDAFASQIANAKAGSAIVTNADVLNVTPVGDKTFTVKLLGGAKFTLSEEAVKGLWFADVEGDVVTVYCRAKEATKFNFVDAKGNVIASEILLPGMSLNVSDKSALIPELFDKASGSVVGVTGWTIDLGNGPINASGYVLGAIDAKEVTVTPTIGALATINTYAIYVLDANGNAILVGDASDYASMDNFKTSIQNAPDGATAVLLYAKSEKFDMGVQTQAGAIAIGAGKTFSLDLNGRTLVDGYSNKTIAGLWGGVDGCAFNVGEGSTFNFYSSQDGAVWYQLKYNYTNSGDAKIFSKGIVTSTAKKATVNFGDVYAAEGNLIIDSADFTVYGSLVHAYQASGATTANSEFNINVNGGTYLSGMGIGRYAMISSYLPVTNVTINNATLINDSRDGYAIFSIWNNGSIFNVTAKNSTLISVGSNGAIEFDGYHKENVLDEEGNPVLNADGSKKQKDVTDTVTYNHYYENCTIIATKYGNNGYTGVTLGEGNFLSGMTYLKRADGVASVKASTSVLLNYPKAVNKAPLAKDGKTEQLDGSSFKKVEIGGVIYYTIADSLYDVETWKNEVLYAAGGYYTYKGEIPADIFDKVSFKTTDGKLLATELWFKDRVGEDNFALAQPANVDLGMYTANGATWSATDKADEFVLAGYTGATGNFKDMLVNAALSTGMTYNIYVPADAGITITEVKDGTLAENLFVYGDKSYYVISVELAAADFEAKNVTVTFTAESITGGDAVTGTQTLVADIVGYANKVSETFKHDTEEAILIVNMMQYKQAVAQALAKSAGTEYVATEATAAFFAAHLDCNCAEVSIEEPADEFYDIDELLGAGLKGATFTMDSVGEIKLIFEPVDAANTDLVITVKYSDLRRTYTLVATYNADAKCYITPGIPAAYIDNAFSITVGDGEAVGIYSLYAYIEEMIEKEEENEEENEYEYYISVAEALAEYAAAAEAYKYITNDEVVE